MILNSQRTRNTLQASRAGAEQIITESVGKQTQRRQLNSACSLLPVRQNLIPSCFCFSSTPDPSYSLLNFCLHRKPRGDGGEERSGLSGGKDTLSQKSALQTSASYNPKGSSA